MAEIKAYPTLSSANWWKLREKFYASFPRSAISEEYLASILSMKISSVKNNGIILNLKYLGLIDDENKCTDLANRWRMDETYPDVCAEIRNKVYPSELIDIGTDRVAINSWFMAKNGAGTSQASKLTALYLLVSNPEIKKPGEKKQNPVKSKYASSQTQNKKKSEVPNTIINSSKNENNAYTPPSISPSVNLNLQIHISAEASSEQIDHIFMSMAKHLYGRE
ncbi:MAG: hypothetical protein AAGU14_06990 [Eubacteriaceae bacterium]